MSSPILRQILPLAEWAHAPALRRRSTLVFAAFVGYPLLCAWLIQQEFEPVLAGPDGSVDSGALAALKHDLRWLDWPFVAYFGAAWLLAMWLLVRPRLSTQPITIVLISALITGGPLAIWLEDTLHAHTDNLITSILTVGASEELTKMVPLVVVLALLPQLHPQRVLDLEPRAFLYLGCVSGVVFGCAEGVEYIMQTQSDALFRGGSVLGLTETVFVRLITDPINHAIWAGTTGFFVGLAVSRARRAGRLTPSGLIEQSWLIGFGLALTASLHGLHDFAGSLLVDVLVDVASALILLGYITAGEQVERALAALPAPHWGSRAAAAIRPVGTPSAPPPPPPWWPSVPPPPAPTPWPPR